MTDIEDVAVRYAARIRTLVAGPDLSPLIERYLDPAGAYAAFSFDTAGDNPDFELTTDDLLALNFLDLPIRPMSYRRLLELKPEIDSQLLKLSPDVHLWQMNAGTQLHEDADRLWRTLTSVAGVGRVRASKLMARKRPKLVPILDRWINDFFEGETEDFWFALGGALRDADVRKVIDALRPPGLDTSALSLLRILDIAIWMARDRPPPATDSSDEL